MDGRAGRSSHDLSISTTPTTTTTPQLKAKRGATTPTTTTTPQLKPKRGAVAKLKRGKTPMTGTKQNKAHVKKRKFLRLALALVGQVRSLS